MSHTVLELFAQDHQDPSEPEPMVWPSVIEYPALMYSWFTDGALLMRADFCRYDGKTQAPHRPAELIDNYLRTGEAAPKTMYALHYIYTLGYCSYYQPIHPDGPGILVPLASRFKDLLEREDIIPCVNTPYNPEEPIYLYWADYAEDELGESLHFIGILMPMSLSKLHTEDTRKLISKILTYWDHLEGKHEHNEQ